MGQLLKIIRFFWGYVTFIASGKGPERFINLAAKAGVGLFNIKKCREKEELQCSVAASEYKALRRIAKKSCIKIRIQQKRGLPFVLKRYKKRKGLFVGFICFALILHFLSLYIWSINITGAEAIDKAELTSLISELGICAGTLKSELDTPMIEKTIMKNFSNIAWASVNVKGSRLSFELKERVEPPSLIPKTAPCNIKASKDGQITRLEVYEGTPEVKLGDAATTGQLLVSGIIEDDFGACSIKHAEAKVYALTKRALKAEVELCQKEKQSTGKKVTRKRLKLFGIKLPLTLRSPPNGDFEKIVQINDINFLGISLPASYYKEVWTQMAEKEVKLSPEEALQKANEELEKREQTELSEAKIISKRKVERILNGRAVVEADYSCEEDISQKEEIKMEG